MFYSLIGELEAIESNFVAINCGGVCYKCLTSESTQSEFSNKIGDEVKVFTHLNVRQDAIDLFGFSSQNELNCFKLLTSVSGVGARFALAILSNFSSGQISSFIALGDSKSLTSVSGIGNKIAQRIVLELKGKFDVLPISGTVISPNISTHSKNIIEAAKALGVLGYSQNEVMPILSRLDNKLTIEELIKLSLQMMNTKGAK